MCVYCIICTRTYIYRLYITVYMCMHLFIYAKLKKKTKTKQKPSKYV